MFFVQLNSNTMETKSLTILINECVMLMRGVGYSEKSILRFKQIWESKLNHFMSVKGLCKFPMREKLPSVYSTEEITIIGSTINRKGLSGKRLLYCISVGSNIRTQAVGYYQSYIQQHCLGA